MSFIPRPTLPETATDEINDRGTNTPYYVPLSLISSVALKSKGSRHQCSKDNHRVPCNTNLQYWLWREHIQIPLTRYSKTETYIVEYSTNHTSIMTGKNKSIWTQNFENNQTST